MKSLLESLIQFKAHGHIDEQTAAIVAFGIGFVIALVTIVVMAGSVKG